MVRVVFTSGLPAEKQRNIIRGTSTSGKVLGAVSLRRRSVFISNLDHIVVDKDINDHLLVNRILVGTLG